MDGGDLLVLAPWALFAAGLAAVSLRLRQPRRAARRGPATFGGRPEVPGRPARRQRRRAGRRS